MKLADNNLPAFHLILYNSEVVGTMAFTCILSVKKHKGHTWGVWLGELKLVLYGFWKTF